MGYVTIEQHKDWRRPSSSALSGLDIDIDEDDELLQLCIDAGAARVDSICRRRFGVVTDETAASERTFWSGNDGFYLFVDDFVGAITCTRAGTVLEATTMPHDNDRPATYLRGRFTRNSEIVCSAKWGWPALPSPVAIANHVLAARLFELKLTPFGVRAELGVDGGALLTGDAADRAAALLVSDYVKLRARLGR